MMNFKHFIDKVSESKIKPYLQTAVRFKGFFLFSSMYVRRRFFVHPDKPSINLKLVYFENCQSKPHTVSDRHNIYHEI